MLIIKSSDNSKQLKKYGITRLKGLNGDEAWYEYEVVEIKGPVYEHVSRIRHRFLDGTTKLAAIAMTQITELRSPDAAN